MKGIATICVRIASVAFLGGALGAAEPEPDALRTLTGLDPQQIGVPVRFLVLVTVLGAVPSVVLLATCFPRILIILSFLRRALGAQDLPSSQVLAGLTLILTILIMLPVWRKIHTEAYLPLERGEITDTSEALDRASGALRQFMLAHTLEKDLELFLDLSRGGEASEGSAAAPGSSSAGSSGSPRAEDAPFFVVLPAFVLSELKVAFQMGFLLYLPFLVIDLAVSAVLISMGMFMLPPLLVSLPIKVLVFVLADGWNLVVGQVVQSFRVMS